MPAPHRNGEPKEKLRPHSPTPAWHRKKTLSPLTAIQLAVIKTALLITIIFDKRSVYTSTTFRQAVK